MELSKINAYRQVGIGRLEELLLKLPEQPQDVDYFVDQAIRQLSNLPQRPNEALPYQGLYGPSRSLNLYRDKATMRLQELLLERSAFTEVDTVIDHHIRVLSDLPDKPAEADPYVRLFMLRDESEAPDPMTMMDIDLDSCPDPITEAEMLAIVGTTQFEDRVRALVPGINATFNQFSMHTPLRKTHFLAQVLHESGGFRWLRELWGPTEAQRRYEPASRLAADLGNTQPGDGRRFAGRGVIQLTGRSNYAQFSRAVGVDFVAQPELVAATPYAVLAAGWYWQTRNLNAAADQDDLIRVTRLVNGGRNGLSDRRRYLNRAKQVLGIA